jgi:ADP-ribosyl-[dinitrogen reductase] hydrolase
MSGISIDVTDPDELARKMRRYEHLLPPMSAEMEAKLLSESGAPGSAETGDAPIAARLAAPALPRPVWPKLSPSQARDRALGCFLGLAVGDAVGTTVEFKWRDSFPPVTDMTGGGPFKLQPGEWTDDTTMALCLADSLLAAGAVDQQDLMTRLRGWLERGENTIPRRCFDIGSTTRTAIERFIADGNPSAGSEAGSSAGNGSLVRLAPLAIFYAGNAEEARFEARKQSRTTHATQECLEACALFVTQLLDALAGADKDAATHQRVMALTAKLLFISGGDWKTKTREEIKSSGYVVHTLEAALWSVWQTDNFRDAVLTAVNLGDDADSVGAVAGQLAGALYGASGIPPEWLAKLAWRDKIERLANHLFDRNKAGG